MRSAHVVFTRDLGVGARTERSCPDVRALTLWGAALAVPTFDSFHSHERRNSDRSVVTEQRASVTHPVVPWSELGARTLGHRYWVEVTRATRGLVRCRQTRNRVELTVLGVGPPLLRLAGAEVVVEADRVACTYRIRGGLLALREGGALAVSQIGGEQPELRVTVEGFFARLGDGVLYDLQHRAHSAVSRRYLRQLLAEASA